MNLPSGVCGVKGSSSRRAGGSSHQTRLYARFCDPEKNRHYPVQSGALALLGEAAKV